jgi:small-conductance mechanosensitive channel
MLVLSRLPRPRGGDESSVIRRHVATPSRLLVAALAVLGTLPALELDPLPESRVRHALVLVMIGAIGWLIVAVIGAACEILTARIDTSGPDNLRQRRAKTQATIARGVASVVVGFVTATAMLMTFSQVRALGAGLLASAGIIGVIVGVAAQSTLANLLAGIQIAITEPIRLDDVVVVEGEWGRIEEITFTYVVVRSWDERRVVLPISYFTQTPFENWTRRRAQVMGAVYLHVDYTAPVDELREEVGRIVRDTDLWDGREIGLQATDTKDRTLELRIVASAADAPRAWDLRCHIRERLVDYLVTHHPGALPRVRDEVIVAGADAG